MFFGTVDMVSESHVERFSKPRFTSMASKLFASKIVNYFKRSQMRLACELAKYKY